MKNKTTLPPLVVPPGSWVHGDISITVNTSSQATAFVNAVREHLHAYTDDPTNTDTAPDVFNSIRVGISLGKDAPITFCGPIISISPIEFDFNGPAVIHLHF